MGSSDESSDGQHLLSRFQAYRPSTAHSNASNTKNHEAHLPKRRGRPKKVAPILNLAESDGLPPVHISLGMRRSRHTSSLHTLDGSVDALQNPHSTRHENSSASRSSVARLPSSTSMASSQPNNATGSRSRRSKAQIRNYYSNSHYSGYVSSSDGEDERTQVDQQRAPSPRLLPAPPPPKSKVKRRESRVIYDSCGICILRHPFAQLDDVPNLPDKVPYSSESGPSSYAQRFRNDLQTPILHVSFSDDEIAAMVTLLSPYGVDSYLFDMCPVDQVSHIIQRIHKGRERQLAKRISKMAHLQKLLTRYGFDNLAAYHQNHQPANSRIDNLLDGIFSGKNSTDFNQSNYVTTAAVLRRRRKADIRGFIKDARLGNLPTRPFYVSATQERVSMQGGRGQNSALECFTPRPHKDYSLQRSLTWKGASNDVINLAWSPDGSNFAVGAAAQCDEHNMQYNRSNNLILGDLMHNSIKELPDHRIPYPVANPNNTHLYMSVSAVQWFDDTLYTSSYDKTVKIWDVSSYTDANCVRTLRHDSKVQVMARSHANPNILATGTDSTLHLWHFNDSHESCLSLDFLKQRSIKNPRMIRDIDLLPASLAWGPSPITQNLLVAGFAGKGYHESDACREGLLAMWRLTESSVEPFQLQPNAQNTFDVKFHPTLSWVATGTSVPSMGSNGTGKDVRSLVRIYEPLDKRRCAIEFDCPALDMNDVSFCPMGRFYISASCTDGVTYVWDFRNPSRILHELPHGNALNQLDEQLTREQADVGVRVALWGDSIENFITGGSDGVLRAWNILLSPDDAHVRDIVTLEDEVMSGAFSPDKSTLLIGDAAGGIHILQPDTDSDTSVQELHYDHGDGNLEMSSAPSDSGREIGQMLLKTGQLVQHPKYGIGQGPAYQGPYAAWARPEGTPDGKLAVTPLLKEIQALQLDQPNQKSHDTATMASQFTVDRQRKVAEIRNRDPSILKRKHHVERESEKKHRHVDVIDLCSDDEECKPPVWIDLTSEPDIENVQRLVPMDEDGYEDDSEGSEDYWFPESCNVDPNIRESE
ncbi:hypothetical protein UA08_07688 [Talaromyces atroroseus]|uniref:Uncharacterized protein n=1 Tax=Talaromyces atroroseus TaxID=1441469 RepID=A0A225ADY1_TALAT|nr:hypothetical protein UA08_07688 [Talaromyces atroroseus]OKL57213.1 hypothetical protein UA08_07688 [Talaromyces atroroseus]